MIPFDKIYSWLFKSFSIHGETELLDRLVNDGYKKMMIIKRSWIFWLFTIWLPLLILTLGATSIFIAYYSIEVAIIKNIIIGGNILMMIILTVSSLRYLWHFREVHKVAEVVTDLKSLREDLHRWDIYFTRFFNWSITNQFILVITILAELSLIFLYQGKLSGHLFILATDTLVMVMEMVFLKMYRKRMMDLEMDYNVVVPGKVFFVNQSGVLSSTQSIESDKIKTVRSMFPSKIASFFNYGNVDILTEWDDQAMIGTMSMYYVTDPDAVVANIQSLLKEDANEREIRIIHQDPPRESKVATSQISTKEHSLDTREKIRDVLR